MHDSEEVRKASDGTSVTNGPLSSVVDEVKVEAGWTQVSNVKAVTANAPSFSGIGKEFVLNQNGVEVEQSTDTTEEVEELSDRMESPPELDITQDLSMDLEQDSDDGKPTETKLHSPSKTIQPGLLPTGYVKRRVEELEAEAMVHHQEMENSSHHQKTSIECNTNPIEDQDDSMNAVITLSSSGETSSSFDSGAEMDTKVLVAGESDFLSTEQISVEKPLITQPASTSTDKIQQRRKKFIEVGVFVALLSLFVASVLGLSACLPRTPPVTSQNLENVATPKASKNKRFQLFARHQPMDDMSPEQRHNKNVFPQMIDHIVHSFQNKRNSKRRHGENKLLALTKLQPLIPHHYHPYDDDTSRMN